jgi:hypothetical protein
MNRPVHGLGMFADAPSLTPRSGSGVAVEPRNSPVTVLFLRQNAKTVTYFWNWLTEVATGGPEIHCELYFPETRETCTIDSSSPVYFQRDKQYLGLDRDDWEGFDISLTASQYATLYRWCRARVREPFDSDALRYFCIYRSCGTLDSPWYTKRGGGGASGTKNRWLCSRLIAAGLKEAQVLPMAVDPYTVSPVDLKEMILQLGLSGAYTITPVKLTKH